MGLTHSDIGGYTGEPMIGLIRSKELFLRWAEYAAFTPLMRTHEVTWLGNKIKHLNLNILREITLKQIINFTQMMILWMLLVALQEFTRQ